MPKNPLKSFGRRKSSGNVLDDVADTTAGQSPTTSSFRVLERPNSNIQHKFGADADAHFSKHSPSRPFNSPLDNLRFGKSVDELGTRSNPWTGEGKNSKSATLAKQDRGSAGTTNSGSSGYYDSSAASARHSSSSTLPSSVDDHRERKSDELFAHRKPASAPMPGPNPENTNAIAIADAAAPTSNAFSFRSRAARAFSFGGAKQSRSDSQADIPAVPSLPLYNARQRSPERMPPTPHRERATTTSSYASTAVPVKNDQTAVPNLQLATSSFGDDFGYIFANFGEPKISDNSLQTPSSASGPSFHRAESSPMMPPRALSRQTPSPRPVVSRVDTSSPYSFDDTDPHEALMNGSALESPGFEERPNHNSGIARAYLAGSRGQYGAVQDQTSPRLYGLNRTPTDDSIDQSRPLNGSAKPSSYRKASQDDDEDSWVRKVSLRHRTTTQENAPPVPAHTSPQGPAGARGSFDSRDATPRATKVAMHDEPLFDSSPSGPPSRAIHPARLSRSQMPATKKMTRAEFDRLQKGGDVSREDSEDEDDGQGEEEEDEDEVEIARAKQAARQRRKQEANMAVYRQQMKKVTGGGPADLPSAIRPSLDRAANSAPATPSIHLGGMGGAPPPDALRGKATDDDDDDVPLGILQAHGFPSAGRPPTRLADNDLASQRRTSAAGSVVGGGAGQGSLPPFARRLPADPYFGASVVNQPNRESLAFGANGGSVYGGAGAVPQQPQNGHPAGLVGVIAGEERARAARRGSPNPTTGTYAPNGGSGLPSNMQLPRTMSMGNITPPGVYNPSGMPQMPMMPGMMQMPGMQQMPMIPPDASQQQMQQFMQMQMQFMQNMIAMQQQAMAPPQQDMGPTPRVGHRPSSSMSSHTPGQLAVPNTGRAMTMMGPPASWDAQGLQRPASSFMGNYTPSVHGMNLNGGSPGAGYTPSIAPSERSNIGMPSRYRPVSTGQGEQGNGRTHSMTSSMTLQAFKNQQGGTNGVRPPSRQEQPATIRVIDKPKGSPKIGGRVADDDDEEGWAEMTKKRTAKKFSWRKKDNAKEEQQALSELYQGIEQN